jgi:hypothetical protein
MRLDPQVIATLQIINEEFFKLKGIEKINSVDRALAKLLNAKTSFENETTFIADLNSLIRKPLYTFFISNDICNCNRSQINALFNILVVLATYWPINTDCCISNANAEGHEIAKENRALFLSGHVADKQALIEFWNKQREYTHPKENRVASTREILWIFPNIKLEDYELLENKSDVNSSSSIKQRLKAKCAEKVNFIFTGIAIALTVLIAVSLLSMVHIFAVALFTPLSFTNFAALADVTILSSVCGIVQTYFLKSIFCNWVAKQQYNEIETYKKDMNLTNFEAAKVRNTATEAVLKLVRHVRNSLLKDSRQRTSDATQSNLSTQPPSLPIEPAKKVNPEPTDWRKMGLHAVATSTEDALENKEEAKQDLSGQGLRQANG